MSAFANQLLEAWHANNRINLLLLEKISDEGLRCTLSKRGGRDVARQFAHLNDIRVRTLQGRAEGLGEDLELFPTKVSPSRRALREAFTVSGERIGQFLVDVLEGVPKRRGFARGAVTHLSYFVAHESHHRGSILLTLKECGHAVDKKTAYAIWNWNKV